MRAALYARVSTRDGRQDTENQLAKLREYAAARGWTTVEYIDEASAKSGDRDAFRRLFDDAAQRKFSLVLVWSLDRLTREGVLGTFQYIEKLTAYGIQFESLTEPHFRTTGPAGELMLAIAAWIAKQERLRIAERTKAGLERYRLQHATGAAQSHSGLNMPIGRPVRIFRRDEALRMHAAGVSYREIARQMGVAIGTVHRACRQAAG